MYVICRWHSLEIDLRSLMGSSWAGPRQNTWLNNVSEAWYTSHLEKISNILGLLSKEMRILMRMSLTVMVQSGWWIKWSLSSGVLRNKKVPQKIKGNIYRVIVRPTMLYEQSVGQSRTFSFRSWKLQKWGCNDRYVDIGLEMKIPSKNRSGFDGGQDVESETEMVRAC